MTTTLHLFTGKGGVGKTTLATAWAIAAAQAGQRVMLAELYGGGRISALLQREPTGYRQILLQPNLWYIDITPWEALKEYAHITLKVPIISNALADHPLVQAFLQVIPGLSEMVLWGKLWYHTQEHTRGEIPFDMLIIDAPATGHAKALLKTPGMVQRAIPLGPMQRHATHIEALLHSQQTYLHVVTIDEELPMTEACELLAFAQQHQVQLGHVFVNQISTALSPQDCQDIRSLGQIEGGAMILAYLQTYAQSLQQGLAERQRLTEQFEIPLQLLPAYPRLRQQALCAALIEHIRPLLHQLPPFNSRPRK